MPRGGVHGPRAKRPKIQGRVQAPYQREQGGFARARSHGFDGVEGLHAEEILGYVREVFSALTFFENIFGTSASENHKCARKREEKKRGKEEICFNLGASERF